jgi:DUF1365 family protein
MSAMPTASVQPLSRAMPPDPAQGPSLFEGRVRHARIGAHAHAFEARSLIAQVPLRAMRAAQWKGGLGFGLNRRALINVQDRDHGNGTPMLDWAEQQLREHGIDPGQGEIWLCCLPRLTGFAFKPVSFWICCRTDGSPQAIIAEVNNTFGDRHVYLLETPEGYRNGQTLRCEKTFYVSPFCEARGEYHFRFFHSAQPESPFLARIDYFLDGAHVLATSISGKSQLLTQRGAFFLWLRQPLASLAVLLNIHWQALLLWRKGLRLVPKPSRV